jgi:trans-aconitate methyltransferase
VYLFPYTFLMSTTGPVNLWTSSEHAKDYLERADQISHRTEGEAALLEFIPPSTRRILDLGTGDGRLLALVRQRHPDTDAVAVDFGGAQYGCVSSLSRKT